MFIAYETTIIVRFICHGYVFLKVYSSMFITALLIFLKTVKIITKTNSGWIAN